MPLISAVILAAGESRRMGQPKLLLPWGETTVLGQVVSVFSAAGIEEIVVVTGGARPQVEGLVEQLARKYPIRAVYNPDYAEGGMLSSIQAGLRDLSQPHPASGHPPLLSPHPLRGRFAGREKGRAGVGISEVLPSAALIGLGDQPQVQEETIRSICAAFTRNASPLVIPSFENRRGHPWLVSRPLWPEFLALPAATTPRQFLDAHAGQIEHVAAGPSILQDLDTPEEYARQRPGLS